MKSGDVVIEQNAISLPGRASRCVRSNGATRLAASPLET